MAACLVTGYFKGIIIFEIFKTVFMNYQNLKQNVFKKSSALLLMIAGMVLYQTTQAQTADGNNGINQANTMVRSYFDTGTQLMYAVGAILGLVGAVRVYQLWGSSHGEAG